METGVIFQSNEKMFQVRVKDLLERGRLQVQLDLRQQYVDLPLLRARFVAVPHQILKAVEIDVDDLRVLALVLLLGGLNEKIVKPSAFLLGFYDGSLVIAVLIGRGICTSAAPPRALLKL